VPTTGDNQTKADQTKKGGAPSGEGQAAATTPATSVAEAAPATGAPAQSRKPAMKDWGEDDSDYDEDENEGPCEDDHVQVGSSHYKAAARDGQRNQKVAGSHAADRPPTEGAGDDLQFLNAAINQKHETGASEGSATARDVGDHAHTQARAGHDGPDDAEAEADSAKRSSR